MEHVMHLNKKYFDLVANGKKSIEIRLLDDKRSYLSINDIITFINQDSNKSITVKVNDIKFYTSFKELFFDSTKDELLWINKPVELMVNEMHKIYPPSLEEKYGVIKISFMK